MLVLRGRPFQQSLSPAEPSAPEQSLLLLVLLDLLLFREQIFQRLLQIGLDVVDHAHRLRLLRQEARDQVLDHLLDLVADVLVLHLHVGPRARVAHAQVHVDAESPDFAVFFLVNDVHHHDLAILQNAHVLLLFQLLHDGFGHLLQSARLFSVVQVVVFAAFAGARLLLHRVLVSLLDIALLVHGLPLDRLELAILIIQFQQRLDDLVKSWFHVLERDSLLVFPRQSALAHHMRLDHLRLLGSRGLHKAVPFAPQLLALAAKQSVIVESVLFADVFEDRTLESLRK